MKIRKLDSNENLSIELLLLADPLTERIEDYGWRGECSVAKMAGTIIGYTYYSETMELLNIGVMKAEQALRFEPIVLELWPSTQRRETSWLA